MEKRSAKDYTLLMLKGMGMGAADVVPGVSGGTIAFIVGNYCLRVKSQLFGKPSMPIFYYPCYSVSRSVYYLWLN